jgi:putative transposase
MDNAVAESFSYLLKRERIKRKTSNTRDDARQDGFNYIELFYNPKRMHAGNWFWRKASLGFSITLDLSYVC